MEKKDLELFFSRYIRDSKVTGDEIIGLCPFHSDTKRSFSANLKTGLFKCFAESCPVKQGNLIQFVIHLNKCSFSEAIKFLKKNYPSLLNISKSPLSQNIPEPELVNSWKESLLKTSSLLDFANVEMGWDRDLIKKFHLGFDGSKFTIPIYQNKKLINVRKYNPYPEKDKPKYSGITGHNQLAIYPEENLEERFLFLFEGEKDLLLANKLGIKGSITFTGGAGSYDIAFNKYFKNKKLRITYDNDEAGRRGAVRVSSFLKEFVEDIKILELPLKKEGEDFTDWVLKEKGTVKQFYSIEKEFPYYKEEKKDKEKEVNIVELVEASDHEYYFKKISTTATLVGRDLAPYLIPKKVEVSCSLTGRGRRCYNCELGRKGGVASFEFQPNDPLILSLVDTTDFQVKRIIKEKMRIYTFCNDFRYEVLKAQNIIRLKLIPNISYSSSFKEYTLREAFFLGTNIKSNQTYQFLGITLPNPKNQYATHIFYDAQPIETSLDKFKITTELKSKLEVFQKEEEQTVKEKLNLIYEDLSSNVTRIYGREDLLIAFDLAFHSILQFKFRGKIINKGWSDILILGDTKTGKTETAISLIEHYRLGDIASGESSSLVGLLGGLQQTQQRWHLTWGKIPLNDRKLLIIDETSGLTIEQIAALSEVRSSGIAEITKIQTEKTFARTRLIWLSNPRKALPLSYYSSGVEAVRNLIGRPEDISRFDYILTLGENEVSSEIMNEQKFKKIQHIYTTELCHYLILWTWTRKVKDIIFEKEVEEYILSKAIEMSKIYSSEFPLVTGAEQRIKLARMSIAVACRLFSTDEMGEKVIVKKEHVDFILDYLENIYNKSSFSYSLLSIPRRRVNELRKKEEILSILKQSGRGFLDFILNTNQLRLKDLEEISGWEKDRAREFLTLLLKVGALQKSYTYYRKTPAFINFLKKIRNEVSEEGISSEKGEF